jgi:uncharacterized protein (TIGR00266 family)
MSEANWHYAQGQQQVGPMTLEELVRQIPRFAGDRTLVYGPNMTGWMEARHVQAVVEAMSGTDGAGAPPPIPPHARADQIQYEIFGSEMQYAEITLDAGGTAIAEAGSMMYMTSGIQMETVFGDGSRAQPGLLGKLMSAGKRMITGESLFMTTYTNTTSQPQRVAFASPYPGKILAMNLGEMGGELICQKDAFLCAARGVSIGIAFQKKLGVGLFGGEGFIMQRLTGDGVALVHAGGTLVKKSLSPGESLKVDTGCIVALHPSVSYDIQFVGGFKNTLFGGEGLFFAVLSGPGDVWLQSLPFSRLAGRVLANSSGGKEEGSLVGGIGRILDGDNA